MPRPRRQIETGVIYHVLNRGNGRRNLFGKPADFEAFVKLLAEALERFEVDLLAFCLMSNHWHLLLRPRRDGALSRMLGWLTVTHTRRHHAHYLNPGSGHLYQGRFKSFPVQSDEHFLIVARYVHANPLRAGLVETAQAWKWSDLTDATAWPFELAPWPVDRPRGWRGMVNRLQSKNEAEQIQQSIGRGRPYGSPAWVKKIASRLHLESTLVARGRPRKPLASLSARYRKQRERSEREGAEKSR